MGERLFDALIVIDVQQALVDGHPSKEDSFLVAVGAMIDACRRAGVPVLYVCHDGGAGDELERGTDGWRVHCAVAPQAGEIVVDKRFNSAFRQTGFMKRCNLWARSASSCAACRRNFASTCPSRWLSSWVTT